MEKIMDDVLGSADRSNIFPSFSMVTRKFGHHYTYIFHIILPEREIWKKITSQIKIFNIFLASVLFQSIMKILQANIVRATTRYLLATILDKIFGTKWSDPKTGQEQKGLVSVFACF